MFKIKLNLDLNNILKYYNIIIYVKSYSGKKPILIFSYFRTINRDLIYSRIITIGNYCI